MAKRASAEDDEWRGCCLLRPADLGDVVMLCQGVQVSLACTGGSHLDPLLVSLGCFLHDPFYLLVLMYDFITLFSCILRNAFSALVRWTSLYSGSGFCSLCSSVVAAVLMCSTTLLRPLLFFFLKYM
ncbi:unnamed protein product [Ixodes persulcatus]